MARDSRAGRRPRENGEPIVRKVGNNSAVGSDYGNDFQSITGSTGTSNSGSILGTGCIAGGQTTAMALTGTLNNQYTRFRFAYTMARAPATTPVVLFIDGANANLTVPGLCTTLFALPTLQVPMGNSDSLGAATVAIDNVGYSAAAIGASIFSQAVALDATQVGIPVALSNGRNHTFPAQPATPAAVTRGYEYTINTTNAFRAASVWTGGIVTRFD